MVALNFSSQFADSVAMGLKRQTIRRDTIARPGDRLQCFEGQRTKRCRKLIKSDPVCVSVEPVKMCPDSIKIGLVIWVAGPGADAAARDDGFADYREMWAWFADRYKCEEFAGVLIKWKSWAEARDAD